MRGLTGMTLRRQSIVAVALSGAAGFVDAFGYMTLNHVFTAQMSGNTVLVAVHALGGETAQALRQGFTIAMFVAGAVGSGVVIELALRAGIRHMLAAAMALEGTCLAIVALLLGSRPNGGPAGGGLEPGAFVVLVGLTTIAMGIQNASLRMSGALRVYTTHVTGTLTKLSEDAVDWVGARLKGPAAGRPEEAAAGRSPSSGAEADSRRSVLFSLVLFGAFLCGAAFAAFLVPRWRSGLPLAVPIAVALAVAALDTLRPLSRRRG